MKVLEVLDSLMGITNNSYNPSLVLNAVFHSSTGQILIWWYPPLRSILEKIMTLSSDPAYHQDGRWETILDGDFIDCAAIYTHTSYAMPKVRELHTSSNFI